MRSTWTSRRRLGQPPSSKQRESTSRSFTEESRNNSKLTPIVAQTRASDPSTDIPMTSCCSHTSCCPPQTPRERHGRSVPASKKKKNLGQQLRKLTSVHPSSPSRHAQGIFPVLRCQRFPLQSGRREGSIHRKYSRIQYRCSNLALRLNILHKRHEHSGLVEPM